MATVKRPPQLRNYNKHTPEKEFYFFNDNDITLKATFSRDLNGKVSSINFNLKNTLSSKFKICAIVEGTFPVDNSNYYDTHDDENLTTNDFKHKVLIHLKKGEKVDGNFPYTPANPFEFNLDDKFIGLFWVHLSCPINPPGNFPDGIPDTKDGSIIIHQ